MSDDDDPTAPLPVVAKYEAGILPQHGVWLRLHVLRPPTARNPRTIEVSYMVAMSQADAKRLGADLLATSALTHPEDFDPRGQKPS